MFQGNIAQRQKHCVAFLTVIAQFFRLIVTDLMVDNFIHSNDPPVVRSQFMNQVKVR